jgi:hypothetical protein
LQKEVAMVFAQRVFSSSPQAASVPTPLDIPTTAPVAIGDAQGVTTGSGSLSLWLSSGAGGQTFTLYLWNSKLKLWNLAAATAALSAQAADALGVITWAVPERVPFAIKAGTALVVKGTVHLGGANNPDGSNPLS